MIFTKGILVQVGGTIDVAWFNMGVVKSFKDATYYNTTTGKQTGGVLQLDIDYPNGAQAFIDITKPIETKSIEEFVVITDTIIEEAPRKRGRPRKEG